jgi:osmotically-inducible protein OsmY
MSRVMRISEMSKFRFGSVISCTNGENGVLSEVFLDPSTRRLTGIGVRQGRLFGKTTYAPFEQITGASSDGVSLNAKRGELSTSEPGGVMLNGKSRVERAGSSSSGSLALVAVHPDSGELTYVVARSIRQGQDVMFRAEFVNGISSDRLTVTISDDAYSTLPPYRPDDELQQEVESILFDVQPMHIDLKAIQVHVLDGVLYLDGNISSSLRSDIAQDQVYGVNGLLEIKNNLVADDTLAGDIAMALGQDPRTSGLPIGVYPRLGDVRLSGAVRNNQQKEAAVEIASKFPGVRSVTANFVIDPNAEMLHVMSAPEGGEMEDKIPGKYVRHTQ